MSRFARNLAAEFREAEDNDAFSSYETSFELSSQDISLNSTPVKGIPYSRAQEVPTLIEPCSPPYKRVRALRLFNSPKTPKSILNTNQLEIPDVRNKLSQKVDQNRSVTSSCGKENERPAANINPFTPTGMLLSKKRSRSVRSLDVSWSSLDTSAEVFDADVEPPTKRLALKESNILRYRQEFLEVELIGQGQFGSVYKCINRLDGCEYAIKKSRKPIVGGFMEKMAINEVYAHAVLGNHEHVVRYFSAWSEDDHMIIQNEYCNCGSLADKIAKEPLSVSQLYKLVAHVAQGLKYIHSKGLVHMDIKPWNIFISKDKRILNVDYDSADDGPPVDSLECYVGEEDFIYKIGDLGHVTSVSYPEVEEGDCRYLSCEVLNEQYDNLPKADIFAFGLTVMEAAGSGPLPKNGDQWHEIRRGKLLSVPQILDRDLRQLLQSMIHPEPAERPAAVQVLQHRALSSGSNKSNAQLRRELSAARLKIEILSKQLVETTKCIKSIGPEFKQCKSVMRLTSRLIGKKFARSASTTNF